MIKCVLNSSFDFDAVAASLVPLHKQAADKTWMTKRSVSPLFDFGSLNSDKNETLVHLLALSDGEVTGANRNGDYFSRSANMRKCSTFLKAGYFHDHANTDIKKAFGRVVAAAHNGPMGRVELVVALNNDKCAEDLQQLDRDGNFPVSMSCHVAYDVCSICGNKATKRADYCEHAATKLGSILDDGRQVYVDNPDPDFFDISKVWRPADRVAYTFRRLDKAASAGRVIGSAELAETFNKAAAVRLAQPASKVEAKRRVYSKIAGAIAQAQRAGSRLPPVNLSDEQLQVLKSASDQSLVFSALHTAGVCLDFYSFASLTGLPRPSALSFEKVAAAFSKDPAPEVLNDWSYDGSSGQLPSAVKAVIADIASGHSLFRPTVVTDIIKHAAAFVKQAATAPTALDKVAVEIAADSYVSYLISFAATVERVENPRVGFVQNLTALRALA